MSYFSSTDLTAAQVSTWISNREAKLMALDKDVRRSEDELQERNAEILHLKKELEKAKKQLRDYASLKESSSDEYVMCSKGELSPPGDRRKATQGTQETIKELAEICTEMFERDHALLMFVYAKGDEFENIARALGEKVLHQGKRVLAKFARMGLTLSASDRDKFLACQEFLQQLSDDEDEEENEEEKAKSRYDRFFHPVQSSPSHYPKRDERKETAVKRPVVDHGIFVEGADNSDMMMNDWSSPRDDDDAEEEKIAKREEEVKYHHHFEESRKIAELESPSDFEKDTIGIRENIYSPRAHEVSAATRGYVDSIGHHGSADFLPKAVGEEEYEKWKKLSAERLLPQFETEEEVERRKFEQRLFVDLSDTSTYHSDDSLSKYIDDDDFEEEEEREKLVAMASESSHSLDYYDHTGIKARAKGLLGTPTCEKCFSKPVKTELRCGHEFCEDCLETELKDHISKGKVSSEFLCCPKCQRAIYPSELKSIVGSKFYERFVLASETRASPRIGSAAVGRVGTGGSGVRGSSSHRSGGTSSSWKKYS